MSFSSMKPFFITLGILGIGVFGAVPAHAADPKHTIRDEAYAVKFVSQSIADPIKIEAGTTQTVTVKFKNIGTATWNAASARFLSAYTVEPRYRSSVFQGSNWIAARETGKIGGVVKPGETGELTIDLKAPIQPGEYREEFYLSAENYTWVKGGYFYFKISVSPKKSIAATNSEQTTTPAPVVTSVGYQASRVILSKKEIEAKGGEEIPVIIAFQNIGTSTWQSYALKTKFTSNLSLANAGTGVTLVEKNTGLAQWGVAREEVMIKVPPKAGNYAMKIMVSANGVEIPEEIGTISVRVTENAANIDDNSSGAEVVPQVFPRMDHEPRIRIGVWKDPADGVKFVSNDDDYQVFDGGVLIGTLHRGQGAEMTYSGGLYYFSGDGINFSTGVFIRLEPKTDPHAVFALTNYQRLVNGKGAENFNTYRGAMEYRATSDNQSVYVIEDTLFEDYMMGIAETSNASNMEYMKALLTAARTYAYNVQNSSKHDTRHFDVVATTGDQLYLGYESEKTMPRVAEAAQTTRGLMVTYDTDANPDTPNEPVITPYFANTDGRTRSWTEVWGGATKPWLVSVVAEYDKRDKKRMSGHGVGMSARDASFRAEEKGEAFDTILKYYYTGVAVEKMYE